MQYRFEDILLYIQAVGKHIALNQHDLVLKQMNTYMQTIKSHKEQIRLLQSFWKREKGRWPLFWGWWLLLLPILNERGGSI